MANNYTPMRSEPLYCLATCILMIIKSFHNNSKLTQEEIGKNLGIIQNHPDEYHLGIKVDSARIDSLFRSENIRGKVEYIKANTLEEWQFQEYIKKSLEKNTHIICTLASRIIYDEVTSMHGHSLLIVSISDNNIEVIDPDHSRVPESTISIEKIYKASRNQNGGLITFSKRENNEA